MDKVLEFVHGRRLSEALHQLLDAVNGHVQFDPTFLSGDSHVVLACHLTKVTKTFDAVVLLLEHLMVEDAMILSRTIQECALRVRWVRDRDTETRASRFFQYGTLEIAELQGRKPEGSAERIAAARRTHCNKSGRLKDNWTGQDFKSLGGEIESTLPLAEEYDHNYRATSKFVHPTLFTPPWRGRSCVVCLKSRNVESTSPRLLHE